MFFSTREPDRDKLCKDRWLILKISEDLMGLTEITDDGYRVGKMVNENQRQIKPVEWRPWLVDERRQRKKEYMKVYMKKDEVKQRMKESQKRYREKKKIMKRVWEANEY